jgi:hypothetical protein
MSLTGGRDVSGIIVRVHAVPVRVAIGASSLAAFFLMFTLDGWWSLVPPVAAFLLPFALQEPIGVPCATAEGTRIVTGRNVAERVDQLARIFGVLCILAFASAALLAPLVVWANYCVAFGGLAFLVSLRGLYRRVITPGRDAPSVTLERETVILRGPRGDVEVVPYGCMRAVEVDGNHIAIDTDVDRHVIDVVGSPKRAAAVARKILEAQKKASTNAEKDTTRMEALNRPSGMSALEWLGRIDALVASGRNSAYRGKAIDEEALWTVLRDDDVEIEVRAAAARVLAASPDEGVRLRVASAASEVPAEAARVRIAAAMTSDVEDAAEQIEGIDREERRRTAGV